MATNAEKRAAAIGRILSGYSVDEHGCWISDAKPAANGYAYVGYWDSDRKHSVMLLAHRVSYEAAFGVIPAGLELDHVWARGCRARTCINPAHLEAVTHAENMRRGRRWKKED